MMYELHCMSWNTHSWQCAASLHLVLQEYAVKTTKLKCLFAGTLRGHTRLTQYITSALALRKWFVFLCYHRDIAPEGKDLADSNAVLDLVVAEAEKLQQETGKRVLWGTSQLFAHPRYMHGAATSEASRPLAWWTA